MLKVTEEVFIDEPTKMQAAATLRRAFVSSTVDVRSYTIRAIEVEEPRFRLTEHGEQVLESAG